MLIPADRPAYRLLEPFFGPNDHKYEEGDCITFTGTPNEHMEPLNEPARKALRAYVEMLDERAREYAEKNGRSFVRRARSIDDALADITADARRIALTKDGPGVPLQGARKLEGGIERIEPDPEPAQTRAQDGRRRAPGPGGSRAGVTHDLT